MTEEQIKQNAEEYANARKYTLDELENSILTVEEIVRLAYIAGAHSRDEEVENLEKLFDKAVQMLKDTYSGSDFFCERLHEIPEEDLHCMTYCDKEDILCDCVLRYLKHCIKKEE